MGLGDVKLLAAAGALWGPKVALLTILFGSLLVSMGPGVLVILRRLKRNHLIPSQVYLVQFGPFLALGLWAAVLWGDLLLTSYMKFVTGCIYH
jgi:leader peptidase (prepilin peptidase)/N-methyltransferase